MGRLKVLGHVHLKGTDFHSTVAIGDLLDAAERYQIHITPHYRDPEHPDQQPEMPFGQLGGILERAQRDRTGGESPWLRMGVEVNIVPHYKGAFDFVVITGGQLDAAGEDLAGLYPVIASFHFTPELGWKKRYKRHPSVQQPTWMTREYIKIVEAYSQWLTAIGHPYEYASELPDQEDLRRLCRVACQKGVALEVGVKRILKIADPDEDTLREKVWLLRAKFLDVLMETNVRIYIGTDIHHADQLQHLENLQLVAELMLWEGIDPQQIIGWEE